MASIAIPIRRPRRHADARRAAISSAARRRPCRRRRQRQTEVAKLIDVSKCIGCKACQSACLEWNDLREEVGVQPRASTTTRTT